MAKKKRARKERTAPTPPKVDANQTDDEAEDQTDKLPNDGIDEPSSPRPFRLPLWVVIAVVLLGMTTLCATCILALIFKDENVSQTILPAICIIVGGFIGQRMDNLLGR